MPRLMLVVDEFQELFLRDDRLAADFAMLLDRLVRQGRSFGMHVVRQQPIACRSLLVAAGDTRPNGSSIAISAVSRMRR